MVNKLSNIQNLLVTLSEESAEISKEVGKALRFGLDSYNESNGDTEQNRDKILTEFYHICVMVEMLQKENALPVLSADCINRIKKDKETRVLHYQQKSKQIGLLE